MEQWKDVIGYKGLYQVSNQGRVRSVNRIVPHSRVGHITIKSRIMQPQWTGRKTATRHLKVSLSNKGIVSQKRLHHIVLEAWVGACPNGCIGCHNDDNPANNMVFNLRWDTQRSNIRDMIDDDRHYTGGSGNERQVIRSDGIKFDSIKDAAEQTKCNDSNISKVCKGKARLCGGYSWRYAKMALG